MAQGDTTWLSIDKGSCCEHQSDSESEAAKEEERQMDERVKQLRQWANDNMTTLTKDNPKEPLVTSW